MRFLRRLKTRLMKGQDRRPRQVLLGLYRGLRLQLDLRTDTQFWLGLYERETSRCIRGALGDCRWAVDAGAGKGELSLLLLERSAADPVWAFEPLEEEREIFSHNLRLQGREGSHRLRMSEKFLGDGTGEDRMSLDGLGLDPSVPGFIKIDVEGAELDVLRGGETLLRDGNPTLLVETHSKELEADCRRFLERLGYKVRIVPNAWWRILLPEHRPLEHNRWLCAKRRLLPEASSSGPS